MKIYTLTGDEGSTSLAGGRRVPKHDLRIEAYGTVDELISWIGLLRAGQGNGETQALLIDIQSQLMASAAALAQDNTNPAKNNILPDAEIINRLEQEIDNMEAGLEPLKSFILPGGNPEVSHCHIARCVCRRAERSVLRLREREDVPPVIVKFLNRLSDFLFVLGRKISKESGNEEIKWIH
jgi:cob(I)alamin adenosyltransferase